MNTNLRNHSQGFTMIEFLVAIAIIGITLGIGLPSFNSMITTNRLSASANDMVTALQYARSEAIKQTQRIGVSIDMTAGTWKVYNPATSATIQSYSAAKNVIVTVNGSNSASTPNYRPDGRLDDVQSVVMVFSMSGTTETRTLTIQLSGKVAVTNP